MEKQTLVRWLVRSVHGAEAVRLVHRGSGDDDRIVRKYDLENSQKDRLEEIAAEVIADAQDECEIIGARSSFIIQTVTAEGEPCASTRHRCEPIGGLPDEKDEEPSREGLLALAMTQLRSLYKELSAAPQRQRLVYEDMLTFQQNIIVRQREEIAGLQKMLFSQLGTDVAAHAEMVKDQERRTTLLERALSEGGELIKQVLMIAAESNFAAAAAANGADPGSSPHVNGTGGP